MKTVGEIIALSADYLQKRGIARPKREAEELLAALLKMARIDLYLHFERPLIEQELETIRAALKRRGDGEPTPYISGEVEFLGCQIQVNRSVLIPRPETEILVDTIVKQLPAHPVEVWDVCAGSGCIGIAIKKRRPDCHVVLTDVSVEALAVARKNSEVNGVDVEFVQGDLLEPLVGRKADVIVCNPPYISEREFLTLDREVREFEPKMALVGGTTGYEFYEKMAHQLPSHMHDHAKVYFEIGTGMGPKIRDIFQHYTDCRHELWQDWSSHDRYYQLSSLSRARV